METLKRSLASESRMGAVVSAIHTVTGIYLLIKEPTWWPIALVFGFLAGLSLKRAFKAARALDMLDNI